MSAFMPTDKYLLNILFEMTGLWLLFHHGYFGLDDLAGCLCLHFSEVMMAGSEPSCALIGSLGKIYSRKCSILPPPQSALLKFQCWETLILLNW